MTETTAVATMGVITAKQKAEWTPEQRHALIAKQGKTVFGIEIKVVDEIGATLPRDGTSQGELMVRGQWILSRYFKGESSPLVDGWFATGDIAVIAPDGVMQIRDRTKDVIKTGGEWISSIDLENAAVGHPAVQMAAVIGVKHPKWDERPLLFIVKKPGQEVTKDDILGFLAERVAKWWVPDDVVFLDALPVGGTGKVQKVDLRKRYGGVFEPS
jgi:fatty-acyl-CoA synthase